VGGVERSLDLRFHGWRSREGVTVGVTPDNGAVVERITSVE
jgi:hypothetical protein